MLGVSSDKIIVTAFGVCSCIREWETSLISLQRSLDEWRRMIGSDDNYDHIQVKLLSLPQLSLNKPIIVLHIKMLTVLR